MPTPSFTPQYLIAAVSTVVGLLVTNGIIDNSIGKLVAGLASVIIPFGFLIAESNIKGHQIQAKARLAVAQVQAAAPAPEPPPGFVAAPVKP